MLAGAHGAERLLGVGGLLKLTDEQCSPTSQYCTDGVHTHSHYWRAPLFETFLVQTPSWAPNR